MNIVNGFDIDTPEGATAYLESEGVDVEAYIEKGMAELNKRKALDLANVVDTCPHCKGLGYDPVNDHIGVHDICPECKGH